MSRLRDVPKRCFPLAFFPILLHPPAPDDVARLWLGRECPEEERSGGASFREVISLCSESLFLTGQRAVLQVVFAVYNCLLIRTRNTNYTRIFPGKRGALSKLGRASGRGGVVGEEGIGTPRSRAGVSTASAQMSGTRGRCACPNCQVPNPSPHPSPPHPRIMYVTLTRTTPTLTPPRLLPPPTSQMPDRPIACAPCVRRTLHDRRRTLDKLTRAHAAAKARLERAMGPRDDAAVDAALASERARAVADDLRDARAENARVATAIREERAKLATMREALAGRAAALDAARATTRSRRTAMFQSTAPEETRLHSLRLKSTRESLAVERARCIARLRFVFPIAAERAAAAANEGIEGAADPNDSKSMITKNAVNGDPRPLVGSDPGFNTRDLHTTKPSPRARSPCAASAFPTRATRGV